RRTLQRFQKVSKHYQDLSEVFAWYPNWRRLAIMLDEESQQGDVRHDKITRQIRTVRKILESRAPSLSLLSKILRRLNQLSDSAREIYSTTDQPEVFKLLDEFREQLDRGRVYLEDQRGRIKK